MGRNRDRSRTIAVEVERRRQWHRKKVDSEIMVALWGPWGYMRFQLLLLLLLLFLDGHISCWRWSPSINLSLLFLPTFASSPSTKYLSAPICSTAASLMQSFAPCCLEKRQRPKGCGKQKRIPQLYSHRALQKALASGMGFFLVFRSCARGRQLIWVKRCVGQFPPRKTGSRYARAWKSCS